MVRNILSIILLGFLIILLIPVTISKISQEDSLSTTIFGKVLNSNGTVYSGVEVIAIWRDINNIERTSITKTLSKEDASAMGDSNLEGYFIFQQELITRPNSEIIVRIADKNFPENISSEYTPTNNTGESSQESDTSSPNSNQSRVSKLNNSIPENTLLEILPTTIFGEFLDEEGIPIEDEEISAEWTDEQGIKHTVTTKTLTNEKAEELGNINLRGYYIFNKGMIRAKHNTTITLSSKNRLFNPKEVKASPGESVVVEDWKIQIQANEKDIIENSPIRTINYFRYIFTITLLIILGIMILYRHNITKGLKEIVFKSSKKLGSKKISIYLEKKLKYIMNKNVPRIQIDDNISGLINLMLSQKEDNIIVMQGKTPSGVISKEDIVKKVVTKKITSTQLRQVIDKDFLYDNSSINIFNATKLLMKHNKNKLVIAQKNKILGIITLSDLLREYNSFLRKYEVDTETSIVKYMMSLDVDYVSKNDKLGEIIQFMIMKNIDYVIVVERIKDNISVDEVLGIITLSDILAQFYKNQEDISMIKASNMMKAPVIFINQEKTIISAISFMVEKGFKRFPVVSDEIIVGILTQDILLKGLHDFLSDIMNKADIDDGLVKKFRQDL
ncbi:MAG: CBS domain-containing protein, partial [Nanoarchaeota archaeon]